MKATRILAIIAQLSIPAAALSAQAAASLSPQTRQYVSVSEPVVALTNVTLIDGTGAAPKPNQTVVIQNGRIAEVGAASSVRVPAGARTMDLAGSTVIPGIVGMHDHLFYTAAGGRAAQMSYTGPRLYLGSGVTTIRTTGGRAPYAEINTKESIDSGRTPGPRVHLTAPYITGGVAGSAGSMAEITTPDAARRFVAYWAQEGVTWIKAYTDIRRAELKAAIEEAHKRGIKVTGHLCSVSFREAVELGIDNLEHGLLTATDFDSQKKVDACPANSMRTNIDTAANWAMTPAMFKNAMAFERAFAQAGGRLAAGVDPTGFGGALPGFGDQRNYELLVEAGFTPAQTVQIMTSNGAKILGVFDKLGSVERGKLADLVVLQGDLTTDPSVIRKVSTVFKDGVGYDSAKLIAAVKGRVGID